MKSLIAKYSFLLAWTALIILPLKSRGQEIPEAKGFVNDYAGILTQEQSTQLNTYLTRFAEATSTEIVVATLDLPEGYMVEEYSVLLAEKWGIGGQEKDNGLLIAIYPNVRKTRIEVGYGLEGAIPDLLANRVYETEIRPYFQNNDYYGGIANGVQRFAEISQGAYSQDDLNKRYYSRGGSQERIPSRTLVLIGIIILFFILNNMGGGNKGGGYRRRGYYGGYGGWWIGGMGGGYGNGGGGSFGGSSFGGGGSFGGFGGGSFGGGGATGDW